MPVKAARRGGKWIVVESATGKKMDHSGMFRSKRRAQAQAKAVNASLHRRGKI